MVLPGPDTPASPRPPKTPGAAPPRRAGLAIGFGIVLGLAVLLAFEGAASLVRSVRETARGQYAEWFYCEYDSELGWISRPRVRLPDFFGPGRGVVTNSRRFRHAEETAPARPAGTTRIVCSGDSFTFGYGVDTRETWCNLLPQLDPALETVNMGQGGYGLDQAYLWYLRDGLVLEHDVHVLAFVAEDMRRMEYADFLGYGKPVLVLAGGALAVENTPVPRRHPAYRPLWRQRAGAVLRNLEVSRTFARRLAPASPAAGSRPDLPPPTRPPVVDALIADLAERDSRAGRTLLLVYLPVYGEYFQDTPEYRFWSAFMRESAARHGARYLDLVPELRALAPEAAARCFLGEGDVNFRQAVGHYSAAGNQFVAARLLAFLRSGPAVEPPPARPSVHP